MSRSVVSKRFVQKLFPHDGDQMYASYACVHADVWFRDICPFARQIAHHVFRLFDHALNKSGTPLVAKFVRREQVRVFNDPVFQHEEHPDV